MSGGEPLRIDASYGEGGGQILRSSLTIAAATGRAVRLENIRAGRARPGLAAQHLTAVRAAARVCGARLTGDELGSRRLVFEPAHPPRAGRYRFDVGEARKGGSAGSAPLVLQTVLLPLVFAASEAGAAGEAAEVEVRGGTHVPHSPCFEYLDRVWLPALARLGCRAQLQLERSGWYPVGEGVLRARVEGGARRGELAPLELRDAGGLDVVSGRAVAANLPASICQRLAGRARSLLETEGVAARIEPVRLRAACPGAVLFLAAERERGAAGFTALGAKGKPSEQVAEEAVSELLSHLRSGAACDRFLGDQLLVPLAFAAGRSQFTVERVTRHLTTNAWLVERFGLAEVSVAELDGGAGSVVVVPGRERA